MRTEETQHSGDRGGPGEPPASAGVYEIKFHLPGDRFDEVILAVRSRMRPDPFGAGTHGDTYRTQSIYFDTPDYSVFHQDAGFDVVKYRIRKYGTSPHLFFEEKNKKSGIVRKRRTRVEAASAEAVAEAAALPETAWFRRRLEPSELKPVCQIGYERIARTAVEDGQPLRLTIDRGLRAHGSGSLEFRDLLAEGVELPISILEIKYPGALPQLFKNIIREFSLNPTRLSKYRSAMRHCGIVNDRLPDGD